MAEQQAQGGEGEQATRQQGAFPPPPPYFQCFRETADGAEPPLQPPPLPPPDATFQMFGELHTAQPGIAPLAVRQIYEVQPDGSIDFKGELRRLNRELLFAFTDMLTAITQRPSQSARSVELIGVLARNIQHLLNLLRPYQAAATLEHLLQRELDEQQEAVSDLRQRRHQAQQLIEDTAQQLAALGQSDSTSPTAGAYGKDDNAIAMESETAEES